MQISVVSDDGLVMLPVANYEDVAEVFFTVAGSSSVVEVRNLIVIGCIGQGLFRCGIISIISLELEIF
jgi:hypothetical protein